MCHEGAVLTRVFVSRVIRVSSQWRIQDFPEQGSPTPKGGAPIYPLDPPLLNPLNCLPLLRMENLACVHFRNTIYPKQDEIVNDHRRNINNRLLSFNVSFHLHNDIEIALST